MTAATRSSRRVPTPAAPAHMRALAKLPIFLDLAGKRAVVAGGNAPAAWKAELLAAAGASVEIYAEDLGSEMAALLVRGAASGSFRHFARPWSIDCLSGAVIAIADVETADAARAFVCAAKSAGVPVNVIDKPDFCQFQFGAIVNRSPVVVAISTDGAAPILGQAVRRRIETLLPPSLAAWGQLAKDIRGRVGNDLPPGPKRRYFWERFVDCAFGPAPTTADGASLDDLISAVGTDDAKRVGSVTLVGAGPGDPDLLTLKAMRTLQAADVILFDDLVSDAVLELARREAKRMLVGKRGDRDSCSQIDINALMITLARQGKHVVRLKSGDPMIFGRAGEEIEALEREGIPVSVVPGISAASAMASQLKTSLTHRDSAHSVRFVTGRARTGQLQDDLDWRGLADPTTSLVVYMGGRTVAEFASRLVGEGLAPSTPAVATTSVSRPDQRTWTGTLDAVADGITTLAADAPVLIGIGAAFAPVLHRLSGHHPLNHAEEQAIRVTAHS